MWVYLNGSYIKAEDAKISPLDRSATFGDGIYEVISSYDQELFLFEEHFERLKSSLYKAFSTKSLKIGKAALDPVSYFPSVFGLS